MIKTFWKLSILGAGALLASVNASNAQQNCAPRAVVIERLATTFGETRQSLAMTQNNTLLEVFASLETGSWTITLTHASGKTCLVASGQAFELDRTTQTTGREDA